MTTEILTLKEACQYARNELSGKMTPKQYRDTLEILKTALKHEQNATETLRKALYANSPFDLASANDDKYRDAIDATLGEPVLCTLCGGTGIEKNKHNNFFHHCTHCKTTGLEPKG